MRIGKIEWNYSLKMQYRNWIRRLYFSHSLTLFLYIAITGSLSLSLRHSIFYEIFHSISASCANFIFPLFGNINYEIIHLCCNLHTIPACPIYASWLCSSCHCLTTVLILCRTNTHTHTHWISQENGKCLRLDSIRSVYRVHLFLSHRVFEQFEGRHERDVNVNGLKAAAAIDATTVSVHQ